MTKVSETQQQAVSFLEKYYAKLNGKSRGLSRLYDASCEVTWPETTGGTLTLKSVHSIDAVLSEMPTRPQYEVTEFAVQRTSGGLFLLVHGERSDSDKKTYTFVHSFNLCRKGGSLLVLNEIMLLTDCHEKCDAGGTSAVQTMAAVHIENKKDVSTSHAESVRTGTDSVLRIATQNDNKADCPSSNLTVTAIQKNPDHSECGKRYSLCIITDKRMEDHKPDYFCTLTSKRMLQRSFESLTPEIPERIASIMKKLKEDKILERVQLLSPTLADLRYVQKVHKNDYLDFLNNLPMHKNKLAAYKDMYTSDMFCSSGTPTASFLAAGAVIQACDSVGTGKFEKAFAVVRPPGHHASERKAEGYCFLNNLAIGATYLVNELKFKKILVVDFDVHHCNGTQKIFYERSDVLVFSTYCSTLGYPEPEEMNVADIGLNGGKGYNINVPLVQGFGNADMLLVWKELLLPIAREFSPQIILVSAGYDAAEGDVGKCSMTPSCYATLLDELVKCDTGGVVLALEGGYNLEVLAECAAYSVRGLLGDKSVLLHGNEAAAPEPKTVETIVELKGLLSNQPWKSLKEN